VLARMSKMKFGLDFTTHVERVCNCSCQACQERGFHSVGNCEFDCHEVSDFNANQYCGNS
jgi:hypothetical protein